MTDCCPRETRGNSRTAANVRNREDGVIKNTVEYLQIVSLVQEASHCQGFEARATADNDHVPKEGVEPSPRKQHGQARVSQIP